MHVEFRYGKSKVGEKENMKAKGVSKGFTLVEVIVVLVVLAILAAILIPAMVKWIDKANEKAGIVECRQVVIAAQTIASEAYGTHNVTLSAGSMMNAPYFEQVKALAQVPGTIVQITLRPEDAQVIYVAYITTRSVQIVYELDTGYAASTVPSNTLPGIQAAAGGLLQSLLTDPAFTGLGRAQQTQKLQADFLAAYGGVMPQLSTDVANRLIAAGRAEANVAQLNWRPMLSNDGQVFYVASNAPAGKANPNSAAIYYNNKVYYWKGYNFNATANVSDQTFNIATDLLGNLGTSPQTDVNKWIELP